LRFRIFELRPVPADIKAMMPLYTKGEESSEKSQPQRLWSSLNLFDKDANKMESREKHMCIHAKSFVLDDKSVWIGSFNFDPRSTHLNTEVALLIYDPKVAQAVKENILRDIAPQNSWTIGKKKQVPVLSTFTNTLGDIVRQLPLVDLWPFRYTSSFELKAEKGQVPFYDDAFYDHYDDVGSFPDVGLSVKEAQIELLKTIGGFAEPLI
ncbi:MAG: hypothetical protein KC618_03475, partial [Candidatus Omnitrophica bacterium]|nr:hypothetical protein [Candidatus Omnitrophota bacterium]